MGIQILGVLKFFAFLILAVLRVGLSLSSWRVRSVSVERSAVASECTAAPAGLCEGTASLKKGLANLTFK